MSRRTYNERRAYAARVMRFRQEVYRDHPPLIMFDTKDGKEVTFTLTNGCRLLLLRLSDDMDQHARVSVPRSVLAEHLGTAPPRITEWVHAAQRFGFLTQVRRGRPGVTAVYQGLVPSANEVREGVPSERYARADHVEVRPGVPTEGAAWYATDHRQEVSTAVPTVSAPIGTPSRRSSEERVEPFGAVVRLDRSATHGRAASA